MNLINKWNRERSWLLSYSLAILTVILAVLLTLQLWSLLHSTPTLLFFACVMFSSWYGGLGPGLVATVLSVFSLDYFLLPPVFALSYASADILRLSVFIVIALLTSWLNARRIQVEEELRETEKRLRLIVEGVKDYGFFTIDPNGYVISWNQGTAGITGYQANEILGQHISRFYTVEDIEQNKPQHGLQVAATQGQFEDEGWRIRKDGTRYWAYVVTTALRDEAGNLQGFSKMTNDITKRKQAEELAQKWAHLFENAEWGVVVGSADGKTMEMMNPAFAKMHGYTVEELTGKPIMNVFASKCAEQLKEYHRICHEQGHHTYESKHIRKNGTVFPVIINSTAVKDIDGKLLYCAVNIQDITERKRKEEELFESEQRFRATFNQAAVGIAHVDINGRWLRVNHKLCDIVGYTQEELLERTFHEITYPEDLDSDLEYVRHVLASKIQTYSLEKRYIRKNDSLVWINLTVSLVRTQEGEPNYFISVIEDISKRKQAEAEIQQLNETLENRVKERTIELSVANEKLLSEIQEREQAQEALRESEKRYRQIVEFSPNAIVIHNGEQIVFVNSAAVKIFAATNPQELIGRRVLDFVHLDYREVVKERLQQLIAQKKETTLLEQKLLRLDGTVTDIEVAAIPFTYQNQPSALVVVRDISDAVAAAAQRKHAEEQLRQSLEKERELSELKSRIITTISHEYRTPLTSILSSAELLEHYSHKWSQEKKLTHLHRIQISSKHLSNLVSDVLFIGKAETDTLEFNPISLDLEQFCQELVEQMQLAVSNHTTITFSHQGICNDAYLDERLLRQILTNLLSNAIKYSPQGGTVRFDIECLAHVATLRIQDAGIGIPVIDQERLFEFFHRGSNVGTVAGTGLGLAIVKKCVDLHRGQIAVDSVLDVGTTFTLMLPLNSSVSLVETKAEGQSGELQLH
ncbi:MAG TPA: PAS domain S-box protein [Coleofasciculaceae cyanobacterium]|jgi:PAS domain S-box-containing protein